MKYTHIIWDFNGTILDDVTVGIETVNDLLKKRNLKPLESPEEYRQVFCFPIKEYYRRLGFDFEAESFETLAVEWVAAYRAREKGTALYPGARAVLERLKAAGYRQVMLSATESDMLRRQLKALEIDGYFCEVLGLDNIYAHSKAELARCWAESQPRLRALMIGDTVHDREVAACAGFDCVLVSHGHHAYDRLCGCGVPVIAALEEIFDFLD